MKTNRSKELLKNTIIIFAGKFSTQFLNFLLLPIFTNFLANEEYGTIDLIITYLTLLVPIVTLQIESGTFRFLIDNRNNRNKCCDILKSSFKIILKAFLFILCLSVVLLCFYRSKLLLISVACIFAMIISNYFLQVARGFGKNNHYSICSIIIGVSNIIFNYIFIIKMHVGGIGILYSTFISNSIGVSNLFLSSSTKYSASLQILCNVPKYSAFFSLIIFLSVFVNSNDFPLFLIFKIMLFI